MRKLSSLSVDSSILEMYFKSCVLSVINFCFIAWAGNASKDVQNKINRVLKHGDKMVGEASTKKFINCDNIYRFLCNNKINSILRDETHPFYFKISFSRRGGRTIHLKCRTARYFNSFLSFAIRNFSFSPL